MCFEAERKDGDEDEEHRNYGNHLRMGHGFKVEFPVSVSKNTRPKVMKFCANVDY